MPSEMNSDMNVLSIDIEEALRQIEAKALITEDGTEFILTEDGQPIIVEDNT